MSKTLIKKHNFEIAKREIERFSRNLPSNPSFERVEVDGGLFGWGDHKVTGTEMNQFIEVVQNKLISVNTSLRSIIGEFKQVYNAFDFLDGEYINGIIGSVECAEEASKQALTAQADIKTTVENLKKTVIGLVDLKKTVERIENTLNTQSPNNIALINERINSLNHIYSQFSSNSHYKDIDAIWNDVEKHKTDLAGLHHQVDAFVEKVNRITERINNDINALQQYRSVLESYKHLGDIDRIWNDVEEHKADLTGLHHQIDTFIEKVNHTKERINNDIAALQQYRSVLESYKHLGDVDNIWSDVERHKTDLTGLHHQVNAFIEKVNQTTEHINNDITTLQQYRSVLESYKHLGDIDSIWNDVEEHKTDLVGLHHQIDAFISEVHTAETEIKESIQKMEKSNANAHLLYEKKIKIAYSIGGTAVGLSIIQFILQIMGVL